VRTQSIEYTADGRDLIGHLAVDDSTDGPRPAVLVCHEGPGLDDHARSRAERLASMGYVAFALDYHGGGKPMERDEMYARLGELIPDAMRTRALGRAGLDILLAQPEADRRRVAAIGYCFGGTMAIELARSGADLRAVVGFHAGLGTSRPEDAANIKASVLACIGADDPLVPEDQRRAFEAEMRAAGVDWRLYLFGGAVHSFTNERADLIGMDGIRYHRPTDERSWRAMVDLFEEKLLPV